MSDDSVETGSGAQEPQSAGARLSAARVSQGLRLETAAESLGLARSVIAALEADDYARLGAPVYVRGYLRKYARFLDLSGDELVACYERGAAPRDPDIRAHVAPVMQRRGKGRRPVAVVVTVLIIVVLILAGIWAWRYMRHSQETTRIPPAAASASLAFTKTGFAAAPQSSQRAARVVAPPAVSAKSSRTASVIVPPTLPGTAATQAAALPTGALLTLHVHDPSWIEVSGADRTRLYYNLAPAGKTLDFNAAHGTLTVFLGNATGVDVEVNGKPFRIPARTRSGNTARFEVTLAKPPASAQAP